MRVDLKKSVTAKDVGNGQPSWPWSRWANDSIQTRTLILYAEGVAIGDGEDLGRRNAASIGFRGIRIEYNG